VALSVCWVTVNNHDADEFRRIALALPEAEERAHMAHPDFRVRGKIFATLGYPDDGWGMVKLNPEQQHDFVRGSPGIFVPVKGSWGRRGCTSVRLEAADAAAVRRAMATAWRNIAPKALAGKA
jgi:hypothetical protein